MNQQYFFHDAKWVGAAERELTTFSVLRGHFPAKAAKKASLAVLGLGFFKCYINGTCINPDTFLPLSSEYEVTIQPEEEVFNAQRIYVPQFDITPYLQAGNNTIDVHFGGGWYTFDRRPFGLPKAIYCVTLETENGTELYGSDEHCRIGKSVVCDYLFTKHEDHNYLIGEDWSDAVLVEPLETEYCTTDCPADGLIETLPLRKYGAVYDCGQNTTGYPVLTLRAKKGETVRVRFSEELLPDGTIDTTHHHGQEFTVV